METPVQLAGRLLAALHELVGQEGMYLHGGYYDLAAAVRARAAPLVHQLASLAGRPGVEDFRSEVAALLGRSALHAAFLREKLAELGVQIRQADQARHRVARVAPAYAGTPGGVVPRFQAAG